MKPKFAWMCSSQYKFSNVRLALYINRFDNSNGNTLNFRPNFDEISMYIVRIIVIPFVGWVLAAGDHRASRRACGENPTSGVACGVG